MARIKNLKGGGKKKSRFFALMSSGGSFVANFSNPRTVVERLRKNSRDRTKVFSVNNN
ncbi:MAG: hypothetical protein JSV52_09280 [Candidatus Zixiibacteriota bacterium]|nr:MAG: hypothetical protein JSV52_09280 [candidate division Zixibacteria bacterium]